LNTGLWKHWLRIIGTFVIFGTSLIAKRVEAAECAGADLVVQHAHIITMDSFRRIAAALAVRDGRIVAVGSDPEIARCVEAHTKVLDLAGRTVLPGLIDVHTHAILWAEGVLRNEIDLAYPEIKTIPDVIAAVQKRAASVSPGAWIQGTGWDDAKLAERRYITRQDLDAVSPNNPVYLEHVTGHLGVANSAALKIVGIARDTPNPDGGVIEHDDQGELTGIVKDNAMRLVGEKIPDDPPEFFVKAAALASQSAAEVGLTTIHDIWDGVRSFSNEIRGYQQLHQRGDLKIRVLMAPGVAKISDAEELARMGVHTGFGDDHLKFGAVKMFSDGGMGARTAAIYPPAPVGQPQSNLGLLIWKPEDLQKAQYILASAGWQLSTHAIGDRAIDEVLDGYAATVKKLNLQDPRFRVIHCGISTPRLLQRLAEQHVVVDADPAFVYWIGSYFERYGFERARWAYPTKSYFDHGIVAGAGSDTPVTPISPWWGLWAAVVRQEVNSGKVLSPDERVTVTQALEMYTRNGAYAGFEEKQKGSLEVGKFADFIVIDRDVLAVPSDELKQVRVLHTFVDGQSVYESR